jgi:hypothetical protein
MVVPSGDEISGPAGYRAGRFRRCRSPGNVGYRLCVGAFVRASLHWAALVTVDLGRLMFAPCPRHAGWIDDIRGSGVDWWGVTGGKLIA